MPLDIQLLRDDPKKVQESQRRRYKDPEIVTQVLELDNEWKKAISTLDSLRKASRQTSKQVGSIMQAIRKEKRQPTDEEQSNMQKLKNEKTANDTEEQKVTKLEKELKDKRDALLNTIGNIVADSVPISNDEEKDNALIRKVGKLRGNEEQKLRHHHELLWMIGGYEPDRGVSVCGHRGYFLTGPGVLLNLALQNYGIQYLVKREYKPVYPPFFMDKPMMAKTAQLEDFDESLYHVTGESMDTEKYLIATSEQPISAMHHKEWLQPTDLPLKYAGISTCFRKEAGAHGKDAWGIFRVHQFDKIEQFIYCEPKDSWDYHEEIIQTAEEFYRSLGIPYRIVSIVSGHLNNAAAKKYDLEGWFPTLQRYRELVSASNCTDYQAIGMETRFGFTGKGKSKESRQVASKEYVHMLNATLVATTRTICAILENYQTDDGIIVPEVLRSYMGGMEFIPFVRPPPVNKDKIKQERAAKKNKQEKHQQKKPSKQNDSNK
eukprot:CAMPEP_0197072776 /NCGR_PEP_ID=MMETSP1384-20130603/210267_1 /TAXON_ID=29189 /ORGANISM="Ammonia sp." /LENGTH=489 /DNA_ID=CAMNT_0042511597 /DNA_START=64 /DNA_END=1533 /DNA_ORIENTATION=-